MNICGLTVGAALFQKNKTKEYEDSQMNNDLVVVKVSVKQTQLLFCTLLGYNNAIFLPTVAMQFYF